MKNQSKVLINRMWRKLAMGLEMWARHKNIEGDPKAYLIDSGRDQQPL